MARTAAALCAVLFLAASVAAQPLYDDASATANASASATVNGAGDAIADASAFATVDDTNSATATAEASATATAAEPLMPSNGGYIPAKGGYMPVKDAYMPTKPSYMPVKQPYVAPKKAYVQPKKAYEQPKKAYVQPKEAAAPVHEDSPKDECRHITSCEDIGAYSYHLSKCGWCKTGHLQGFPVSFHETAGQYGSTVAASTVCMPADGLLITDAQWCPKDGDVHVLEQHIVPTPKKGSVYTRSVPLPSKKGATYAMPKKIARTVMPKKTALPSKKYPTRFTAKAPKMQEKNAPVYQAPKQMKMTKKTYVPHRKSEIGRDFKGPLDMPAAKY